MFPLTSSNAFFAQSLVNGQWCPPLDTLPVYNPATNEVLAEAAAEGASLAKAAVQAAEQAFHHWRYTPPQARSACLSRIAQLMMEQLDDLAMVLTAEQGKPLAEARSEVEYAASYFNWYAAEALRVYGRSLPTGWDTQIQVQKHPVGVVAAITPWNFPCAMLARKMAPALAAGCTFVAKPAFETPLSALALAAITLQAGVPAGVVNMVVGADAEAIGRVFTSHPAVAKITFTGSTRTGKHLLAQAAHGLKPCAMELGGNAPFIVFEDAQLDDALNGLMAAKFRNAGQTCISPNRILLHSSISAVFLEQLRKRLRQLNLGDGQAPNTQVGPLIHAQAVSRLYQWISEAEAAGAQVETFGHIAPGPAFMAPVLVTDVQPDMALFHQEQFGPVLAVCTFDDEAEALELANDTAYGLAAYAYTQNAQRLGRLPQLLAVGMLGLNHSRLSNPAAPFGGVKASGFGREGGQEGIEEYLCTQTLAFGDCR